MFSLVASRNNSETELCFSMVENIKKVHQIKV